MTADADILCDALRPPQQRDLSRLKDVSADDWNLVATLAMHQRVSALLAADRTLPMPAEVRTRLDRRAHRAAMRVLHQHAALRQLADAASLLGIRLMVLKGMYVAGTAYQSLALREMADIDVLVAPEDVDRLRDVAVGLGYAAIGTPESGAGQMARHHLPTLLKPGVALEIHWRLASPGGPPEVDPSELWSRAQRFDLAATTWGLCPEDALLHVCAHAAASHSLELGLRPLCDVRALIDKHGHALDWDVIANRAAQWQCARATALVLTLARSLIGADVPQLALDTFGPARPDPDIQQLAAAHIFANHAVSTHISPAAGRLLATPSLAMRAREVVRRVWLPTHQMAEQSRGLGHGRASRLRVAATRTTDLVRRYGWRMAKLSFGVGSPERRDLDRRNTLVAWLSDQRDPV